MLASLVSMVTKECVSKTGSRPSHYKGLKCDLAGGGTARFRVAVHHGGKELEIIHIISVFGRGSIPRHYDAGTQGKIQ